MIIRAYCKINIGLRVVRRREDGYHDLQTIMYPVLGLYDVIDIEPLEGYDVEFVGRGIVVDCPVEKNLVVRAARLMQQRFDTRGVRITLDKRVPFGAGLGGGSADATAVICAMNEIFELGLDRPTLASIAAELGSDTPFFVYDTPQYCTGRGEIMEPVEVDLGGKWLLVAKPAEGVSTAEAYRGVSPKLPDSDLRELVQQPLEDWQSTIVNDFEAHILVSHPRIAYIKQAMLAAGAKYASMSGSGSAVFAIFEQRPELKLDADIFVHYEQIK